MKNTDAFRKSLVDKLEYCEMMYAVYHRNGQSLAKGEQAIRFRAFVREIIDFDRIFFGIQDKDNPYFCREIKKPKEPFGSGDPF